jgi:hypothetical protein
VTVRSLIDGLKGQPLALALVVINVVYLAVGVVIYREERGHQTAQQTQTAAAIRELIQHCVIERERLR